MRLIVIHNHFRPGGVRRVIELAAPHLARGLRPRVKEIIVAGGELPDPGWRKRFAAAIAPRRAGYRIDRTLLYLAEQRGSTGLLLDRMRRFLGSLLGAWSASDCLVWAHNQGLGRNILLTRELGRACAARGIRLVLHHHDWWFDNRWERWGEMRRRGFPRLSDAARVIFNAHSVARHVAINQADAALLREHFGGRSAWIPNLAAPGTTVSRATRTQTRAWLRRELKEDAPVWLMACRLIRRKNIAEGLLLTRWLRPGAWLVTTGGVSSTEERAYATVLGKHAAMNGWPLRLGILQDGKGRPPSVPELMAASEVVILTSLQEGFGLPYLEAPAARRPLIARALPNVMPDLDRFGFRFHHVYDEILIDPTLFDWPAEVGRQRDLHLRWRRQLPGCCRRLAAAPWLARPQAKPRPVPFSRLTLTAQLEVLKAPLTESWSRCARLNPFLRNWRVLAGQRALRVTGWPAKAREWLGGTAYVRRFRSVAEAASSRAPEPDGELRVQQAFMRRTLSAGNLYPLTWSRET